MGYALGIKKNGTLLTWVSRDSKIFECFSNAPPDGKWGRMSQDDLFYGFSNLMEDLERYENLKDSYERTLERCKSHESIFECICDIKDAEKEIEEIKEALAVLRFLEDVLDDESDNEWGVM